MWIFIRFCIDYKIWFFLNRKSQIFWHFYLEENFKNSEINYAKMKKISGLKSKSNLL